MNWDGACMTNDQNLFTQELSSSIHYGFIDANQFTSGIYSPKLILNKPEIGQYVLTDIQEELDKCLSFAFSVAFISKAGIAMLKSQLADLADKNIKGKLLISPYLGFNDPNAMRELLKLKNVQVRITKESKNMHAKCYIFNHGLEQVAIVGSSNLTHTAMKINYEWNIKLTSSENGDLLYQTQQEFNQLWDDSVELNEAVIEQYSQFRNQVFTTKRPDLIEEELAPFKTEITPNAMQNAALQGLRKVRTGGAKRALVISATGTGKTYLSAFDVKQFQPERFLFIVHREQILQKALKDYQKVLAFEDNEATIYRSGDTLGSHRFVFATIQTLSRDENLYRFASNTFDYILIDEVHKAGAPTYQKIINHFEPDFLLGMTATPERTDEFNIYELFDYNIAYEIRLQEALAENMLCPFMYYGVKDIYVDGELINDKTNTNILISDERVEHILDKINYYSIAGVATKGLIFCSNKFEAHELSNKLNLKGKRTIALTGENTQEERQAAVEKLEQGVYEYILTVDIFNEGIDIPSVNQVVMLRNTQSSIIFVQQLGRGLRKYPEKEFVTVIDFIGNYSNNFLIPIALFGDQSMNKDNYQRKLINRNQVSGITTINFEEVAKEQVFNSIQKTNLSKLGILREKYIEMKQKLGRIPRLNDFIYYDSIDPIVFFERFKHFVEAINKFEKEDIISLTADEDNFLCFLSLELANGKRKDELLLIKSLMDHQQVTFKQFADLLAEHGIEWNSKRKKSIERILTLQFYKSNKNAKYGHPIIEVHPTGYQLTERITQVLSNTDVLQQVQDIIDTGLMRNDRYLPGELKIGEKYSRADVCRLLYWDFDDSSTMYGYLAKHQTFPIFVTYHKDEITNKTTLYHDAFINEQKFHWYTRADRTLRSPEVQKIIESQQRQIALHLFVKKEDAEGSDFYYLGPVQYEKGSAQETKMPLTNKSVVTMTLNLEQKVSYALYRYLIHK